MNIYWPIYRNLETAVTKLTYAIHVDDNQLNVYSSDISNLILRASAEIESISKELYKLNGGAKTDKIKYDADALEHLNNLWLLDEKVILISSINCYQSIKELRPFVKNESSTFHGKDTFTWNNSYQNLKHDRARSISFGSIKYLFDIMSALFLLNIYFRNESYPLEKSGNTGNFPVNMGSELFSIKIHSYHGQHQDSYPLKAKGINECVYLAKYTNKHIEIHKETQQKAEKKMIELLTNHPKIQKHFAENGPVYNTRNELLNNVLGIVEHSRILNEAYRDVALLLLEQEYEAVLNKNNLTAYYYPSW